MRANESQQPVDHDLGWLGWSQEFLQVRKNISQVTFILMICLFWVITAEARKGHVEWSGQMDGLGQPPTVHLLGTGIEIFSSSSGGSRKETELFLPLALPGGRCDPVTPEETAAPVAKASSGRRWLFSLSAFSFFQFQLFWTLYPVARVIFLKTRMGSYSLLLSTLLWFYLNNKIQNFKIQFKHTTHWWTPP